MKTNIFLFIILPLITTSNINTLSKSSEYTMEYYYSLRIHEKYDTEFLLDTSKHESIFFKNPEKRRHFLIPKKADDEIYETIEINGLQVKDFEFQLEDDETLLFNDGCQGILGFGIDDSGYNDLMDTMAKQKIIKKKILYFTTSPSPKIQFPVDIPKKQNLTFTNCSLADRSDLDDDYEDMWACDMSHVLFDSDKNEKTLNDSIEVKTIAAFDAKSYYITVPLSYYDMFEKFYSGNTNACSSYQLDDYTYLQCSFSNETLYSMKDVFFMFEGIAYPIKSHKMFIQMEHDKYNSLIRFKNVSEKDENVWIFGYPFFSSYLIKFDFDSQKIGFNSNNNIMNFTSEWLDWNSKNGKSSVFSMKIVKIIGWICLSIILLFVIFILFRLFCRKKKKHSKGNKKYAELGEIKK